MMMRISRLVVLFFVASISICFAEPKDPCEDYYCANGGVCSVNILRNGHGWKGKHSEPICNCTGEWKGERCDDNPCIDVDCNNGTCYYDGNGSPHCCCPAGTVGEFCTMEATCISPSECKLTCGPWEEVNNGTCLNGEVCCSAIGWPGKR